jgi:glycerate kinase
VIAKGRCAFLDSAPCIGDDVVDRKQRVKKCAEFVEVRGQLVPALGRAGAKRITIRAGGLAGHDRRQTAPTT